MLSNLFSNIQNTLQRLNRQMKQALQEALDQAAEGHQHLDGSSSSSSPRGPSSSSTSFTPRVRDVHAVKQLLMRPPFGLPLELAVLVLDYAEYWPVLARAERADHVQLLASSRLKSRVAELYLAAPGLPAPAVEKGERAKPREVRFWIKSHDQGWVTHDRTGLDPYAQSYSWFDACIFRPTGPPGTSPATSTPSSSLPHLERLTEPADAVEALAASSMRFVPRTVVKHWHNKQTGLLKHAYKTKKIGQWRLQCNRVADRRPWQHRIVWREGEEGDGRGSSRR